MTESFDSQKIRSIAYELEVCIYYSQRGKYISAGYCLAGAYRMALEVSGEAGLRCELLVQSTRHAFQELESNQLEYGSW